MVQVWRVMLLLSGLLFSGNVWAVDSYRFLHVTIDTPWYIFIFLFFLVFAPMILMAVLHWRTALKRGEKSKQDQHQHQEAHYVEGDKHD